MRIHPMCRFVAAMLASLVLTACGGGEPDGGDDQVATTMPVDCDGPSAACR